MTEVEDIFKKIRVRLRELGHPIPNDSEQLPIPVGAEQDSHIQALVMDIEEAKGRQKAWTLKRKFGATWISQKFVSLLSKKTLWFARADKAWPT